VKTPTICLIRHGRTTSNASADNKGEKVKGIANLPLTAEGKKESTKIAEQLKKVPLDKIYYSNLQRAAYTAMDIAYNHDPEIYGNNLKPTKWLRSWDLGTYVGHLYSEAMPMIKKYAMRWPNIAVPGGQSFNSWLKPFLRFIVARLTEAKEKDLSIGLVTHTWPIRAVHAAMEAGNGNILSYGKVDWDTLWKDTPLGPAQAETYHWNGMKWIKGEDYCAVKEPTKEVG